MKFNNEAVNIDTKLWIKIVTVVHSKKEMFSIAEMKEIIENQRCLIEGRDT
ncbi:hypothetical protein [Treponema sp. R80B11-R83G3]